MKKYSDDMKRDLKALIAIPSVEDDAKPGMPFGENCYKALELALGIGNKMGFAVKNVDGYAGHVEFGSGEPVAILCHLDVVPAGDGWGVPPFEGIERDGRIYGRGAMDNKGSVIACLYAMKAVADEKIPLKKSVRLILGCNEESGWRCMDYYKAHETLPETGFSPDADFPVIIAEKGVLHLEVTAPVGDGFKEKIFSLGGGERANVVPAFCECIIREELSPVSEEITVARKDDFTTFTTFGKMAHGSTPEAGKNALKPMFEEIAHVTGCPACLFISEKMLSATDGSGMGIECSDSESGALTLNIGAAKYDDGKLTLQVDIRYPVSEKFEKITNAFKAALPKDFKTEVIMHHAPLFEDADSKLVKSLVAAYEQVTGRHESPIAIGGGTYARVLPHGVAFGPQFPEDEITIHMANEYISVDRLIEISEIYKQAIIELCK